MRREGFSALWDRQDESPQGGKGLASGAEHVDTAMSRSVQACSVARAESQHRGHPQKAGQ